MEVVILFMIAFFILWVDSCNTDKPVKSTSSNPYHFTGKINVDRRMRRACRRMFR